MLVCCNADGLENRNSCSLGRHSAYIQEKYGHEYSLDYHYNSKALKTSNIFFEWLQRISGYSSRTPIYKGKFSPPMGLPKLYRSPRSPPPIPTTNTTVKYLPLNATSKIQHCDAGDLASMKTKHRLFQVKRAFVWRRQMRKYVGGGYFSAMLTFKTFWKIQYR